MTESELQEAFRASVAKAQQEATERQKNEMIDTLTKIMTAAYSQAMAYTNVVIIAGYAAAFTIWNFTRAYLPEPTVLWIALLLTISAAVFVAFEIYKMIVNARNLRSFQGAVTLGQSPEEFQAAMKDFQSREQRRTLEITGVWVVTLCIVIPTGYGAVLILAWNVLWRLFSSGA